MNGLDAPERLRGVVGSYPALQLLVLHGSRARSEAHEWSDWDLAYLAVPELDRHLRRVHEHLPGGRLGVASGKRGRVHEAARTGPADLRTLLAAVRDLPRAE